MTGKPESPPKPDHRTSLKMTTETTRIIRLDTRTGLYYYSIKRRGKDLSNTANMKPHTLHYWIGHKDGYLFCGICGRKKK